MMPMRFGLGNAGDFSPGTAANGGELHGERFAGAVWLFLVGLGGRLVHWRGI
jgi:hypothetical protein